MHLFWSHFHGFSVKFSPFDTSKPGQELLAVAAAQFYGVAGNGRLHVISVDPAAGCREVRSFDTQDGLFDVSWSEINEYQLVGASGDGSLYLWDMRSPDGHPIQRWAEHPQEASCVAWAPVSKLHFASASWDGTVRLWDPTHSSSLAVLAGHVGSVHAVEWHPRRRNVLASCGVDQRVMIWDASSGKVEQAFVGGSGDLLTLDWHKYREYELVTGGVDAVLRVWDTRRTLQPVQLMTGHKLPIRRVRCSPHDGGDMIASASYDMSVCFWDCSDVTALHGTLVRRCEHHREFACGVDFALHTPGLVASTAWDQSVVVWNTRAGCGTPPQVPPIPASMRPSRPLE